MTLLSVGSIVIGLIAQGLGVIEPVDEAARRPDFFAFRAQLQSAVARHDAAAVLDAVAPDVKNSFGGNDGVEEFKQMWRLDQQDSELWQELGAVLALGGTFQGTQEFVAPYTFSRWPNGLDAFDHVAVIGANVRIRSAPRADAATIGQASFSIFRL